MNCQIHYFAILLIFTIKSSVSFEKYWLPDLEWQTAKNWMDNRLPEVDNHVIFPLETRHAVGMANSGDFRLAGIDLARTGSLILPRDGNLQVSRVYALLSQKFNPKSINAFRTVFFVTR